MQLNEKFNTETFIKDLECKLAVQINENLILEQMNKNFTEKLEKIKEQLKCVELEVEKTWYLF